METATITCPNCAHQQKIDIPENGCQAFYKCDQCGKIISVSKDSENCCVICEYSDKKCPVSNAK